MYRSKRWLGIVGAALVLALVCYRLYIAVFFEIGLYSAINGFFYMLYIALEAAGFGVIAISMVMNKLTKLCVVGPILLVADICVGLSNFAKFFFVVNYKSIPFISSLLLLIAPIVLLVHVMMKKRKIEICPRLFYIAPAIYIVFGILSRNYSHMSIFEIVFVATVYLVIGIWIDLVSFYGNGQLIW